MDDGWPASLGPAGSSGSDEPPRFPTGLTPTVSVSSQQEDDADPFRYRVDIITLSPANSIGDGDGNGDGNGERDSNGGRTGGRGEGNEERERERERDARVYEELLGLDRDAEAETRHALDALVFEQLLGSGNAADADGGSAGNAAASTGNVPPTVSITDVGALPRRWSATPDLGEGDVGDGISAPLAPERRRRPAASAVSSRTPSSAVAESGQPDALGTDVNAGLEPYHLAIPAVSLVAKRASLTDPNGARVLEPVFEQRRKVSRQRSLSNPDMSDMRRLSEVVGAAISDLAETYGAAYGELLNDGSHSGGGLHPGHADDGGSMTDGTSDLDEPFDVQHSPSSPGHAHGGRGGLAAEDYVNAADVLGLGAGRAASPMAIPSATAPTGPAVGGLTVGSTALDGPLPSFPTFVAGPYPALYGTSPQSYMTSPPAGYGAVPYPYFLPPPQLLHQQQQQPQPPFGVAPVEGAQQYAFSRQAVADATAAAVQSATASQQHGHALPHHANRRRRVSMSAVDQPPPSAAATNPWMIGPQASAGYFGGPIMGLPDGVMFTQMAVQTPMGTVFVPVAFMGGAPLQMAVPMPFAAPPGDAAGSASGNRPIFPKPAAPTPLAPAPAPAAPASAAPAPAAPAPPAPAGREWTWKSEDGRRRRR